MLSEGHHGSFSEPGGDSRSGTWAYTAVVLGLVLLAGVLLWAATDALSKMDIAGPGWSLRGNGALGLTFTVGPAVMASAWTVLSLAGTGGRETRELIYAGIAALVLCFAVVFGPFLPLGYWPALLSPMLALSVGIVLAARNGLASRTGIVFGSVLLALFFLGILSQPIWTAWAYQIAPLVVAPLIAIPAGIGIKSSAPGRRAFRLTGCLLVPVALTAGMIGTPWIIWALTGVR